MGALGSRREHKRLGPEMSEELEGDPHWAQELWKFVFCMHWRLYPKSSSNPRAIRQRIPYPPGVDASQFSKPEEDGKEEIVKAAPGFLGTHFLTWLENLPEIKAAREKGVYFAEMLELVMSLKEVQEALQQYAQWVCSLASRKGLAWWAVVFELCHRPEVLGRIHGHFAMTYPTSDNIFSHPATSWPIVRNCEVTYWGMSCDLQRVAVKNAFQNPKYQSGALYYVMAQKIGCIGHVSSIEVFEEPRGVKSLIP